MDFEIQQPDTSGTVPFFFCAEESASLMANLFHGKRDASKSNRKIEARKLMIYNTTHYKEEASTIL